MGPTTRAREPSGRVSPRPSDTDVSQWRGANRRPQEPVRGAGVRSPADVNVQWFSAMTGGVR